MRLNKSVSHPGEFPVPSGMMGELENANMSRGLEKTELQKGLMLDVRPAFDFFGIGAHDANNLHPYQVDALLFLYWEVDRINYYIPDRDLMEDGGFTNWEEYQRNEDRAWEHRMNEVLDTAGMVMAGNSYVCDGLRRRYRIQLEFEIETLQREPDYVFSRLSKTS